MTAGKSSHRFVRRPSRSPLSNVFILKNSIETRSSRRTQRKKPLHGPAWTFTPQVNLSGTCHPAFSTLRSLCAPRF